LNILPGEHTMEILQELGISEGEQRRMVREWEWKGKL
jgi:hypothetical protein